MRDLNLLALAIGLPALGVLAAGSHLAIAAYVLGLALGFVMAAILIRRKPDPAGEEDPDAVA